MAESAGVILKKGMVDDMKIVKNSRGIRFLVMNKDDKKGFNVERVLGALELLMMTVIGIGTAALLAQFFGIMLGIVNPN